MTPFPDSRTLAAPRYVAASQIVQGAMLKMARAGVVIGWRDELYPEGAPAGRDADLSHPAALADLYPGGALPGDRHRRRRRRLRCRRPGVLLCRAGGGAIPFSRAGLGHPRRDQARLNRARG